MPIGSPVDSSPPKTAQKADNSKAKTIQWTVSQPRYSLSDVILNPETMRQLLDVISYFQNKDMLFLEWGLKEKYANRDGLAVNLYGLSGTGKTMAAHAIANELNLPMICVDYADIESKYVGETSKNLSSLFKTATEQNAAIFFDEADALLSKRVTNMTSATDVSVNQTRSVLLNLLNDYRGVILFATNFIQNFDAAFLRRIRYHVQFHLPDRDLREKLWRTYIPARMPCEVDYADLAEKFDGISGSDIANAVFSAAVSAARDKESTVKQIRFENAIQHALAVKKANEGNNHGVTVEKRILSAEEAREKLRMMEE